MADGTARERILARVRRGLAVSGEEPGRRVEVRDRIARHVRNLVPSRSAGDATHRLALFAEMAAAVHATVERVASAADAPAAIANYLRNRNLPPRLRHGSDPLLSGLAWRAAGLEAEAGRADPADEVSVSHALAGVAETGTLVLASGPDNPTTLNFLPENHIVVLDAADVVGAYEDAFDRARARYGEGVLPRVLNMITGPSRTADIEQRIELGAHGPRRLHIVIVDDPALP